jgi:hypothetical protein
MGLVGRLEDLALPDILQIISLTQKTGKLTLTRREGSGVIVFKNGKIIYAASDSIRETLGNLLVCDKLITEAILMSALEVQHRSEGGKRLGTILVEKGYLRQDALEKIVRRHAEAVMFEFLMWRKGFFKFDVAEIPDGAEVEVDAKDFLLDEGLDADRLRLEGLKRLEEHKREPAAPDARPSEAPAGEATGQSRSILALLKALLAGVRAPNFASEVPPTMMRLGAEVVERGVLFRLTKAGICAVSQFGMETNGGGNEDTVKKIVIPLNQPSLLTEVTSSRQTYRGQLQTTAWNDFLIKKLGGPAPKEVIAVPLIVDGNVAMIFYGDDGGKSRPIGEVEGLEVFMSQVGLAIEKEDLAKKVESLEQGGGPAGRATARR